MHKNVMVFFFLMVFSMCASATETVWECSKFSLDRMDLEQNKMNTTGVQDVLNTIVMNDEGYLIKGDGTFNTDKYYFWFNEDPMTNKAVLNNTVLVKDSDRFIIYIFRDEYKGKIARDLLGYMAFFNCTEQK